MTIRFAYTNLADTGTLTSKTAATGYPASNVRHPFKTKTYRSTGVTDEWLKWDLATAQSVTIIAIVNTNLTTAATVYFCGHASDLGNTTASWHGTATVDETITIPASGMVIKYFTGASKRWWFLGVAPAGAGTYVEIGRVFFGAYYEPAQNFAQSYGHTKVDLSSSDRSMGGQIHSDVRNQYHNLSLPFPLISKTQKEELMAIFTAVGTHRDIIISLDPAGDLNNLSFYGRLTDAMGFQMVAQGTSSELHGVTIGFRESL